MNDVKEKFGIKITNDKSKTKIFIDDKDISNITTSFILTQKAGEPMLLTLKIIPEHIELDGEVVKQVVYEKSLEEACNIKRDLSLVIDGSIIGKIALDEIRKEQKKSGVTLLPV